MNTSGVVVRNTSGAVTVVTLGGGALKTVVLKVSAKNVVVPPRHIGQGAVTVTTSGTKTVVNLGLGTLILPALGTPMITSIVLLGAVTMTIVVSILALTVLRIVVVNNEPLDKPTIVVKTASSDVLGAKVAAVVLFLLAKGAVD